MNFKSNLIRALFLSIHRATVTVSVRYLIITPPSQNAKSARRPKMRKLTTSIDTSITIRKRGKRPTMHQSHGTRHQIKRQMQHLQIVRKNGWLPHKLTARVKRQRMSNATNVLSELMFVGNLHNANAIAPQLGKFVRVINA